MYYVLLYNLHFRLTSTSKVLSSCKSYVLNGSFRSKNRHCSARAPAGWIAVLFCSEGPSVCEPFTLWRAGGWGSGCKATSSINLRCARNTRFALQWKTWRYILNIEIFLALTGVQGMLIICVLLSSTKLSKALNLHLSSCRGHLEHWALNMNNTWINHTVRANNISSCLFIPPAVPVPLSCLFFLKWFNGLDRPMSTKIVITRTIQILNFIFIVRF